MRMTLALLMIATLLAWTAGCGQEAPGSADPQSGQEPVRDEVAGSGSQEPQPPGGSGTTVSEIPATPTEDEGTAPPADVVLCGKCGQVKGSEICCLENAAFCAECALAKGSPGCCKITKGADVTLCAKCGQVKDSEACCDPDAAVCKKCGLAKGSPGCCTIEL